MTTSDRSISNKASINAIVLPTNAELVLLVADNTSGKIKALSTAYGTKYKNRLKKDGICLKEKRIKGRKRGIYVTIAIPIIRPRRLFIVSNPLKISEPSVQVITTVIIIFQPLLSEEIRAGPQYR